MINFEPPFYSAIHNIGDHEIETSQVEISKVFEVVLSFIADYQAREKSRVSPKKIFETATILTYLRKATFEKNYPQYGFITRCNGQPLVAAILLQRNRTLSIDSFGVSLALDPKGRAIKCFITYVINLALNLNFKYLTAPNENVTRKIYDVFQFSEAGRYRAISLSSSDSKKKTELLIKLKPPYLPWKLTFLPKNMYSRVCEMLEEINLEEAIDHFKELRAQKDSKILVYGIFDDELDLKAVLEVDPSIPGKIDFVDLYIDATEDEIAKIEKIINIGMNNSFPPSKFKRIIRNIEGAKRVAK